MKAFICASEGKLGTVSFSNPPRTTIKINQINGFGLYSEEIYALIDIKKAVDDQIYEIKRLVEGKSTNQNCEIYFALSEGSISIEAVLGIFKNAVENPNINPRGLALMLGVVVIWMSPSWYNTWSTIHNNDTIEKTKIELKKLDLENDEKKRQHELEMQVLKIISNDPDLKKLASRTFSTFAKIHKNTRKGSLVEINKLSLTEVQISYFLKENSMNDDWAEKLEGRFIARKIKKKVKELFQVELENVDTGKIYKVNINMDLYDKKLMDVIHDWHRKGSTLFVNLKFSRKDGEIIRTDLTQIGDKSLSQYKKRK
jgi:hypothetical protein